MCLSPYCDVESKSVRLFYAKSSASQMKEIGQNGDPLEPGFLK